MIIIIPSCIEWLWKVSLLSLSRLSMVKSLYLSYLYRLHRICNGFFANYIALHCHYINLHYSSPEQLQTGTYCKAFSRFWTRIISQIAYDTICRKLSLPAKKQHTKKNIYLGNWGNGEGTRVWTEIEKIAREWKNEKELERERSLKRKWQENEKMAREWESGERMRKWRGNRIMERGRENGEKISLHFLSLHFLSLSIFSFSLHFLSNFSLALYFISIFLLARHFPAGRLPQVLPPCTALIFSDCFILTISESHLILHCLAHWRIFALSHLHIASCTSGLLWLFVIWHCIGTHVPQSASKWTLLLFRHCHLNHPFITGRKSLAQAEKVLHLLKKSLARAVQVSSADKHRYCGSTHSVSLPSTYSLSCSIGRSGWGRKIKNTSKNVWALNIVMALAVQMVISSASTPTYSPHCIALQIKSVSC